MALLRRAPIMVRRVMRRILWAVPLCSTRWRQIRGGERRRKLVKVTIRLPYLSEM